MARARNIKPGFFKNEELAECSSWARLCFAGLWTLADREGRLEDRPKRIKGELFAFDSVEVEPLLVELAKFGFIFRYVASDGKRLIQILKFRKHQNPHHKEAKSSFPSPQSLGLLPHEIEQEPEIKSGSDDCETQGDSRARTDLDEQGESMQGCETLLIPDSLIPDPLSSDPPIPDPLQETAPASPAKSLDQPPDGGDVVKELTAKDLVAQGVEPQVAADWMLVRKKKKAPLTETAWDDVKSEAAKAGVPLNSAVKIAAANNWQGFKDSWLNDEKTGPRPRDARGQPKVQSDRNAHKAAAKQLAFGRPPGQGVIDG